MRSISRLLVLIGILALTACTTMKHTPSSDHGAPKPIVLHNMAKVKQHYPTIWQRIIDGYGIPDLPNDPIEQKWIDFYTSRPTLVESILQRSSKYIHYITIEVEKRNMPTEIALLPFVESAFNVRALSRSRASGLWQFIPSTGREYNLHQSWVLDNRRNLVQSTQAALNYLDYLYHFQNDNWHLALASYNWGQGAVKRAVDNNLKQGKDIAFTHLKLPIETRHYVPKLLAIANIIKNAQKYKITLPNVPDQPYFTEVKQTKNMDVKVAAKLAEMSVEEFKDLNPAFNTPVLLHSHSQSFLLPLDRVAIYERNLKNYNGRLSNWFFYAPKRNESLLRIARRHGIGLKELKNINGYGRRQKIVVAGHSVLVPLKGTEYHTSRGQGLSVPKTKVRVEFRKKRLNVVVSRHEREGILGSQPISSSKIRHYIVRKGDTLYSIARRYKITVKRLKQMNRLSDDSIRDGQTLRVSD